MHKNHLKINLFYIYIFLLYLWFYLNIVIQVINNIVYYILILPFLLLFLLTYHEVLKTKPHFLPYQQYKIQFHCCYLFYTVHFFPLYLNVQNHIDEVHSRCQSIILKICIFRQIKNINFLLYLLFYLYNLIQVINNMVFLILFLPFLLLFLLTFHEVLKTKPHFLPYQQYKIQFHYCYLFYIVHFFPLYLNVQNHIYEVHSRYQSIVLKICIFRQIKKINFLHLLIQLNILHLLMLILIRYIQ